MKKFTSLEKYTFLIANAFLLLGIACYVFLYPHKFQIIHLGFWTFHPPKINIENALLLNFIYAFTSYCYVVFMTFYSVLITSNLSTKAVYQWAIFWGIIASAFELLQLKTATSGAQASDVWLINKVNRYLENGHFDGMDIVFIWLGVVTAVYVWREIKRCEYRGKVNKTL